MAAAPETFCPSSPQHWREWLQAHHAEKQSVWLIYYKKHTNMPSLSWGEAVEEALCFGWIDSQKKPLDDERFMQLFSRRKATSTWSRVNKEHIERLLAQGRMTPAGLACVETARQNGSWTLLDAVDERQLPTDLAQALEPHPDAHAYFLGLSRSDKRALLQWLVLAKRPATRQHRIREIVACADQQCKPPAFQGQRKAPDAPRPAGQDEPAAIPS